MNFIKEYDEAIMNLSPVIAGDIKFAKIYYAHPKNLIKYINEFAIPKYQASHEKDEFVIPSYLVSQEKDEFPDPYINYIKLFKCQAQMNPEQFIQESDSIINTILKMSVILHNGILLNPEKKADLLNDLTYIFRNLYINGACDARAIITFYTSFGGKMKDIGIATIETEYAAGEVTKVYVTRCDD